MAKHDESTEQPIEWDIIEWGSFDEIETANFSFSNITLKVAIGHFPVGYKFAHCAMNLNTSRITFYDTNEDVVGHTFVLRMTVGEKVR